ncbi:unnamed protein product [Lasius platythorax]|uniref:Uncharacterized protein n=1 Tax=Lasius platythorax TaxID=488582 RepID=A0AAV2MYV9_9HYME
MDCDIETDSGDRVNEGSDLSRRELFEIIGEKEKNINRAKLKSKVLKRPHGESLGERSAASSAANGTTDPRGNERVPPPKKNKKNNIGVSSKKETAIPQNMQPLGNRGDLEGESKIEEPSLLYTTKNRPPFTVFFKYEGNLIGGENKSLPILEVSRRLVKAKIAFKSIDSHARNTWKVTFDNVYQANDSIRNREVKNNGFVAFIPRFRILRKGVIRGVPEDVSDEEILSTLKEDNPDITVKYLD